MKQLKIRKAIQQKINELNLIDIQNCEDVRLKNENEIYFILLIIIV